MFGSVLSNEDAKKMTTALNKTLKGTAASLYAELGSAFLTLAHEHLGIGGRLAFILPAWEFHPRLGRARCPLSDQDPTSSADVRQSPGIKTSTAHAPRPKKSPHRGGPISITEQIADEPPRRQRKHTSDDHPYHRADHESGMNPHPAPGESRRPPQTC